MPQTPRLEVGDKAPAFSLPDADGNTVKLSDYKGRRVIVYFYPAASTPGCTKQACDFRDSLSELNGAGLDVIGISPDKPAKLAKFRDDERLTFPLLSDPDREVLTAWGAYGEKTMYGKTVQGVIRSTFVVDEKGKIAEAQYNVQAPPATSPSYGAICPFDLRSSSPLIPATVAATAPASWPIPLPQPPLQSSRKFPTVRGSRCPRPTRAGQEPALPSRTDRWRPPRMAARASARQRRQRPWPLPSGGRCGRASSAHSDGYARGRSSLSNTFLQVATVGAHDDLAPEFQNDSAIGVRPETSM